VSVLLTDKAVHKRAKNGRHFGASFPGKNDKPKKKVKKDRQQIRRNDELNIGVKRAKALAAPNVLQTNSIRDPGIVQATSVCSWGSEMAVAGLL